ncbi:salicylate hydroxylase [Verticillium dahliae]|nr:salicylate hydroxylase [Verticillium dahliae]
MADYRNTRVSIIGAGMGGLTAALAFARKGFKRIDVYENAPALGFVGAGIQIAPNLIRVLDRLDIWQDSAIAREATNVKEVLVLDGPTNDELARVQMIDVSQKYGYAHHAGHRASLAGGIYDAAKAEPAVHFHFGHTFEAVSSFGPGPVHFVVKDEGEVRQFLQTDILIGADGIKSAVRDSLLSGLDLSAESEETGTSAYRILVDREQMVADPELLSLIDSDVVRRWTGPRRHLIAYPVHNHTIYNIATTQPDVNFAGPTNTAWSTKGDKTAMKAVFADFCPLVQKLLDLAPEGDVVEWRLRSHKPLGTWTRGAVALLGDACHPTLPHVAQGAAMAIEDAACLAEIVSLGLGTGFDSETIPRSLKAYERLRKPRTSNIVDLAAVSARSLHLQDGEAKKERDRQFAAAKTKGAPVPDKWVSPEVQQMVYGHDCVQDARERFAGLFRGHDSRL